MVTIRPTGPFTAKIVDEVGTPFTSDNPLPVDVGGSINIEEITVNFDSTISSLNQPSGPLGANANFTGSWEDISDYAAVTFSVFTDQMSAVDGAILEFSIDGSTVWKSYPYTVPPNYPLFSIVPPEAQYFRVNYTNGPVAQAVLKSQIRFAFNKPTLYQAPLGTVDTDASMGASTRAHVQGRLATGVWKAIEVDDNGKVKVIGPATDAELRATPLPISGTVTAQGPLTNTELRASAVPVSGPLTDGQLRASAVPVSGPLTDTQLRATPVPVSGTVTADTGGLTDAELRANPVSVEGPLTDDELRATPVPVSGTVGISGTVPVSGPLTDGLTDAQLRASAVPVSGPLTDVQLRASSVPVSGPLTDSQLRASAVPVSGPLTDSQLRASPLPLPTGAATESTLAARFGTVAAGTPALVNSTTETAVHTPASGKKIRLKWLYLATPEDNSAPIIVTVKIGTVNIYKVPMGAPGAFAHSSVREGAVDDALTVTCSAAQPLYVNLDVEEI
jgi:hypothetical protein